MHTWNICITGLKVLFALPVKANEMLHSSTAYFSFLQSTYSLVSSITPRKLIPTGRIFSTQTSFCQDRSYSNTRSLAKSFLSAKENCEVLSFKSKFSKNKLFSTSSIFRSEEMEEFALAKKYEGSDYNVWWV